MPRPAGVQFAGANYHIVTRGDGRQKLLHDDGHHERFTHGPQLTFRDTPPTAGARGCDWLPTLYSLTGESVPAGAKPFDGLNLMPLLEGKPAPAVAGRFLPFQRNRYAPVRHVNASIREGGWKRYWPGDDGSLKKDSGRDNPSYLRGVVRPHWEMPLDRHLDPPNTALQPPPRLYDLDADPAEQHDLAAQHPEIVKSLAAKHDAWFNEVTADRSLPRNFSINLPPADSHRRDTLDRLTPGVFWLGDFGLRSCIERPLTPTTIA